MHLKKIKKMTNGKYKLIIEGVEDIVTYDDVILNNNILNQKEITNELLLKLNKDTEYYNIYNKVVKYIQTRLRSEKEVIRYLNKFQLNEKEQQKIINDLKKNNFINDDVFAQAYIADKMNLSNYGPNKIKRNLYEHGINEYTIEDLIAAIDYNDIYKKLHRLINKRILTNNKYSRYQLKNKILNNFISLGYSIDMINEIFDELFIENDNIIKKEYNKIFNNLKRKYEGDELYIKVKQKLYQKGYQMNEINQVIKESIE